MPGLKQRAPIDAGPYGPLAISTKPASTPSSLSKLKKSLRRSLKKLFRMDRDPSENLAAILHSFHPIWVSELNQPKTCNDMYNLFMFMGEANRTDALRSVMNSLTITEVIHCKKSLHEKHEFVSFTFAGRDGNEAGFIRSDRTVNTGPLGRSPNRSSSSLPDLSTSQNESVRPSDDSGQASARVVGLSLSSIPATDVWRVSLDPPHSGSDVQRVPIRGPFDSLRLYHIYAAMAVIEAADPQYNIIDRQCYWHAAVLSSLITGQEAVRNPPPPDDVLPENGKPLPLGNRYRFVSLVSREDVRTSVARLKPAYDRRVAEVVSVLQGMLEDRQRQAEANRVSTL